VDILDDMGVSELSAKVNYSFKQEEALLMEKSNQIKNMQSQEVTENAFDMIIRS